MVNTQHRKYLIKTANKNGENNFFLVLYILYCSTQTLCLNMPTSIQYSRRKQYVKRLCLNSQHLKNSTRWKVPWWPLPQRFWSVHSIDILLSNEATGKEMWLAVKRRWSSHDSDNMTNAVRELSTYDFGCSLTFTTSVLLILYKGPGHIWYHHVAHF